MFEKNLSVAELSDIYGALLTPNSREMLELYYNDDLSLSEIAEQFGISRQGVRDSIKRSEEFLLNAEEKLKLRERQKQIDVSADIIISRIKAAVMAGGLSESEAVSIITEAERIKTVN